MKFNKLILTTLLAMITMTLFSACTTIPKGAVAVSSFEKEKYLGKWYEIARMDFRFERNMNNTTAMYTANKDGSIRVENAGYNYKKNVWKKAIGKAKFVGKEDVAMLKVSFFGPFYGGYNVIALDKDYKYALIAGGDLGYLWILSREKSIPEEIKSDYLKKASDLGFNTSELIWVEHNN